MRRIGVCAERAAPARAADPPAIPVPERHRPGETGDIGPRPTSLPGPAVGSL
jgi:hypothetical protein